MLAQNFLTAEELGLTEKGYQGLHKVLRMLEGGELVYSPRRPHALSKIPPNGFNMATCWDKHECGTVGCIGGWAGFYNEKGWVDGMKDERVKSNLHMLFCPKSPRSHYTVDQAAHALRTYLVTGTPDWGLTAQQD